MIDKSKIILKGAVGGALDATLSSFPPTAILWGAIKGGVSSIRTERAQIFVNYIENNFEVEMFEDEHFLDGVAVAFEYYVKQRLENKRQYIKNVFDDFALSEEKEYFELERLLEVVNQISVSQIEALLAASKEKKLTLVEDNCFGNGIDEESYATYKSIEAFGVAVIQNYYAIEERSYDDMRDNPASRLTSVLRNEEYVAVTDFGRQLLNYLEIK